MDDPKLPAISRPTVEDSLEKLRKNDSFLAIIAEMKSIREDQFRALKGAKKREVFEIVGCISAFDDLISMFEGAQ